MDTSHATLSILPSPLKRSTKKSSLASEPSLIFGSGHSGCMTDVFPSGNINQVERVFAAKLWYFEDCSFFFFNTKSVAVNIRRQGATDHFASV